mmetsp:Transcript_49148/g.137627  ORF Transcript_49148/g.137627 Transcript_49148/m.137627 type:complete len:268 (+) Transcript_49148:2484-3287(+)
MCCVCGCNCNCRGCTCGGSSCHCWCCRGCGGSCCGCTCCGCDCCWCNCGCCCHCCCRHDCGGSKCDCNCCCFNCDCNVCCGCCCDWGCCCCCCRCGCRCGCGGVCGGVRVLGLNERFAGDVGNSAFRSHSWSLEVLKQGWPRNTFLLLGLVTGCALASLAPIRAPAGAAGVRRRARVDVDTPAAPMAGDTAARIASAQMGRIEALWSRESDRGAANGPRPPSAEPLRAEAGIGAACSPTSRHCSCTAFVLVLPRRGSGVDSTARGPF